MTAELRLCCCFCLFFSGVAGWCFCGGFCRKRGADRGFLMVNLWWNAGERWLENDLNLVAENMPDFLDLFFGLSRFGNLDQGWVIGLLGLVDFFWARIS